MVSDQRHLHHSLAVVGEVDSEVHEVIESMARLINNALEHLLVDLVWDVA